MLWRRLGSIVGLHLVCLGLFGFSAAALAFSFHPPREVPGATTIDVHQAKTLYDQGAMFIDVRDHREWRIGHITGAVHLDLQRDFERLVSDRLATPDTPLVIYCNGIDCLRSAYACAVSVYWGFREVYYFRSGYFAWLAADYPASLPLSQPGRVLHQSSLSRPSGGS